MRKENDPSKKNSTDMISLLFGHNQFITFNQIFGFNLFRRKIAQNNLSSKHRL